MLFTTLYVGIFYRGVPNMLRVEDQSDAVHRAVILYGNTVRVGIIRALRQGITDRNVISERLGIGVDNLGRQLNALVEEGIIEADTLPGRGRPLRFTLNREAAERLHKSLTDYLWLD